MTNAQIAEILSLSDAKAVALAYLEAAHGDAERALSFAVKDALTLGSRLAEAVKAVSVGFVCSTLPAA